jgi:hypothetical protein
MADAGNANFTPVSSTTFTVHRREIARAGVLRNRDEKAEAEAATTRTARSYLRNELPGQYEGCYYAVSGTMV